MHHNLEQLMFIFPLKKKAHSLHEAIDARNADLTKAENINKGLSKIISNKSEKRQPKPSEEDRKTLEAARAAATKARSNNGAKKDLHPENAAHMTIVYVTPDDPDLNVTLAKLTGGADQNGNQMHILRARDTVIIEDLWKWSSIVLPCTSRKNICIVERLPGLCFSILHMSLLQYPSLCGCVSAMA